VGARKDLSSGRKVPGVNDGKREGVCKKKKRWVGYVKNPQKKKKVGINSVEG